tara:strand:+ start:8720 stop:9043 length:324 start_codon:yes stop_codon:yes gene_type:complete
MNLIIVSNLTDNEGLFFRFLTMTAKKDLRYDVLIESKKEEIDHYYLLLKKYGWFDFVDDFVEPRHKEMGARLDTEHNYPMTIMTKSINCQTIPSLLGQLKSIRDISV